MHTGGSFGDSDLLNQYFSDNIYERLRLREMLRPGAPLRLWLRLKDLRPTGLRENLLRRTGDRLPAERDLDLGEYERRRGLRERLRTGERERRLPPPPPRLLLVRRVGEVGRP
uniref:Uncharacterized protein n=1 Tax=Ceratitis capitata TaxID=7213 RepID=W8C980_CERCA